MSEGTYDIPIYRVKYNKLDQARAASEVARLLGYLDEAVINDVLNIAEGKPGRLTAAFFLMAEQLSKEK